LDFFLRLTFFWLVIIHWFWSFVNNSNFFQFDMMFLNFFIFL
jgi:hypothetical protein